LQSTDTTEKKKKKIPTEIEKTEKNRKDIKLRKDKKKL